MQGTAPVYETNGEPKNERPEVLMNKYKILKEIRDRKVRFSDEVDHRPVRGAEEQAAISARMLYKLEIPYFPSKYANHVRKTFRVLKNSSYFVKMIENCTTVLT